MLTNFLWFWICGWTDFCFVFVFSLFFYDCFCFVVLCCCICLPISVACLLCKFQKNATKPLSTFHGTTSREFNETTARRLQAMMILTILMILMMMRTWSSNLINNLAFQLEDISSSVPQIPPLNTSQSTVYSSVLAKCCFCPKGIQHSPTTTNQKKYQIQK